MKHLVPLLFAAATLFASPASAQSPDQSDAEVFIERAEAELEDLGLKLLRAKWVQWTYVTYDTEGMVADAGAAYSDAAGRLVQEAARYDAVELPYELRRKFEILKSLQVTPAPQDPALSAEVSRLYTELTTLSGNRRLCRPDGTCFDDGELNSVISGSRDPDSLLWAWEAGHLGTEAMRPRYERFAELMNQGAREIGYADLGVMWRSTYDMDPDAFSAELDRLWSQLRPLYESLHCYVADQLRSEYGPDLVPEGAPIPAHLLGSLSGSSWTSLFERIAPAGSDPGYDLTAILQEEGFDEVGMARLGERFYTSLGFDALPATFWERSMFKRPRDRDVVCSASAWDLDDRDDVRIKMCIEITGQSLGTVHHEIGHNIYQRAYKDQPLLFRASANYGFHEALGSTLALSLTPRYLVRVDLLDREPSDGDPIGELLRSALGKVASIPNGLVIDRWRWAVFSGRIAPEDYNRAWWDLRQLYQGIRPPTERQEDLFDPGTRHHIPTNVPYTRYFVSQVAQFQFHRALCEIAGEDGLLHECSIYGNKAAGDRLQAMMELGTSRPWPDALEVLTGERQLDAGAMLEYYAPLSAWLDEQNRGKTCGW